jgi:hypothetical protein
MAGPHRSLIGVVVGVMLVFEPSVAQAQDTSRPFLWDLARSVLIDPTTYAPAALSYGAERADWKTSQVLLDRGWLEQNPRFTRSRRPNDVAISYAAGNEKIRGDAFRQLGQSVTINLAIGVGERVLIAKYPRHGQLLHALSWAGRISTAVGLSYVGAAEHLRQIGRNRQLARENGYSQ